MNDGDAAVRVELWVRVTVAGLAVRGPTCVPDTQSGSLQRILTEQALQVGEFACLLSDMKTAVGHNGNTSGVIAAVLQPAQALDDHLECLLLADIAHDPAHGCQRTPEVLGEWMRQAVRARSWSASARQGQPLTHDCGDLLCG